MEEKEKLDHQTPGTGMTTSDFVTVATFQTSSDAQPLRIALEENGIPVFVADDNAVTVNWLWGPALGYVKVQVPKSQAEAAVEIAKQHVPAKTAAEEEKAMERPATCLACGAEMPEDADTCPKCGWTYQGSGDEPEDGEDAGEAE